MKKFAFRLQRVLDLREAQQRAKLGELGREQQQLEQEEQKLGLFRNERNLQLREAEAMRQQAFSVWSQGLDLRYLDRIARVIDYQNGRVKEQEQRVETARGRYIEARRNTRVLETLRDNKREEWVRDNLREEGKILDEIGSRKTIDEVVS